MIIAVLGLVGVVVLAIFFIRRRQKNYNLDANIQDHEHQLPRARHTQEDLGYAIDGAASNERSYIPANEKNTFQSFQEKPKDFEEPSQMDSGLKKTSSLKRHGSGNKVKFSQETTHVAFDREAETHKSIVHVQKSQDSVNARSIGQRVTVLGFGAGVLKFYGPHATKRGYRCGVQLDDPNGKNNGTVDGHQYFKCPNGYGILVS